MVLKYKVAISLQNAQLCRRCLWIFLNGSKIRKKNQVFSMQQKVKRYFLQKKLKFYKKIIIGLMMRMANVQLDSLFSKITLSEVQNCHHRNLVTCLFLLTLFFLILDTPRTQTAAVFQRLWVFKVKFESTSTKVHK